MTEVLAAKLVLEEMSDGQSHHSKKQLLREIAHKAQGGQTIRNENRPEFENEIIGAVDSFVEKFPELNDYSGLQARIWIGALLAQNKIGAKPEHAQNRFMNGLKSVLSEISKNHSESTGIKIYQLARYVDPKLSIHPKHVEKLENLLVSVIDYCADDLEDEDIPPGVVDLCGLAELLGMQDKFTESYIPPETAGTPTEVLYQNKIYWPENPIHKLLPII